MSCHVRRACGWRPFTARVTSWGRPRAARWAADPRRGRRGAVGRRGALHRAARGGMELVAWIEEEEGAVCRARSGRLNHATSHRRLYDASRRSSSSSGQNIASEQPDESLLCHVPSCLARLSRTATSSSRRATTSRCVASCKRNGMAMSAHVSCAALEGRDTSSSLPLAALPRHVQDARHLATSPLPRRA